MGTFRQDYQFFASAGSFDSDAIGVGYLGLADYTVGLRISGIASLKVDARIDYIPFGNCLSLDGGAFGDLSALPLGFYFPAGSSGTLATPSSNSPGYAMQRVATGPLGEFARVKVDFNGTSNTTRIDGTNTPIGPIFTGAGAAFIPLSYVIDLFAGPQIYITVNNPVKWTALAFQLLRLSGTYSIVSWKWALANGRDFTVPSTSQIGKIYTGSAGSAGHGIFTGPLFEISSGYPGTGPRAGGSISDGNILNIFDAISNPLGTGPDLKGNYGSASGSGLTSVVFSWNDSTLGNQTVTVSSADFDDWTSIFLSFYLPNTLPSDGTLITVSLVSSAFPAIPVSGGGSGTEFSGSVKLGVIKILGTAASGIYRIVADKTSDTVYVNNPINDDTLEFSIPNPHIKTAFIGG